MQNIYFVQANDVYEGNVKSTYIPYASGCIIAYCLQNKEIVKNYRFGKIIYARVPLEDLVAGLENPFAVFFSCSIWNTEYNKAAAQAIKRAYPDCFIGFGGHNISSGGAFLEEFSYIDCLIHRFGEEPTLGVLQALLGLKTFEAVENISFRQGERILTTPYAPQTTTDYPSPYLTGVFDDILEDDIHFSAIFETNRGCPNSCTYCDWGALKSKVRLFPMERVKAELDWFVEHKIEFIFCADGNFCLFSRDVEIAEYVVNCKKKYGYPQVFRVCFTKNKLDLVFKIGSMFYEYDLDKAQTLSFQSMDSTTLRNVGRSNISATSFKRLMKQYNNINIATFTEMILGLPGETYESFCEGIGTLLENGQHYAFFIYPCMLLPNAEMGQKDYIEKYRLQSTRVPFELVHTQKNTDKNAITEYSVYITATYSMREQEWIDAVIFSKYIQALHAFGLLRDIALYYRFECGVSYVDFYQSVIAYSKQAGEGVLHRVYERIFKFCLGIVNGRNAFSDTCEGLGDILWDLEELIFLEFYKDLPAFYREVRECCLENFKVTAPVEALFAFQYNIIKKIGEKSVSIRSSYDFYTYFKHILLDEYTPLEKKPILLTVIDKNPVFTFEEFAKKVIWFGRNKRLSDYTSTFYQNDTLLQTDTVIE